MPLPSKNYFASPHVPTIGFSSEGQNAAIFSAENQWLRVPTNSPPFFEGYSGHRSLNEVISTKLLTGTISWDSDTNIVTGFGTVFISEIRDGQFILANSGSTREMIVVEQVISDTSFKATKKPSTTGSTSANQTYVLPVIFAIGVNRGTCIRGKVVQFPKGHYLGVGDGVFKVNGSSLNASLTLSRTPQFALLNPATGLYTQNDVGIDLPDTTVPQVTLAAVTPTTPTQMKAGSYNIRICAKNTETLGFSNPSNALNSSQIVTITDGQAIRITFTNDMPIDANAWDVYSTQFTDNSTSTVEARLMGPWYLVKTVTETILGSRLAGSTYDLYFSDAEIQAATKLLTFDNFAPVDAEFVDLVNGIPIYFSCLGKGNSNKLLGTSPGPSAIPSKPSNPEAVYLNKAFTTSGGDYIIGELSAKSRLFVLCHNSLQQVILTTLDAEPIAFRSLWNAGFRNPYNVTFVKDYLYGFSTQGIIRSIAGGDASTTEFKFATDIYQILKDVDCGQMLVEYCPKNKALCFFHSAAEKRDDYWVTKVYPYLIEEGVWNPTIVLAKAQQDFIVSGVAQVGNELVMLAGGANSAGVVSVDTYVFDGGDSEERPWHLAWSYMNDGLDRFTKRIKKLTLIGKFVNGATVKLYGTGPNGSFKVEDVKSGDNPDGSHSFSSCSEPTVKSFNAVNFEAFTHYSLRIEGISNGTDFDRFDKMGVTYEINSSES